ncbi:MAG: carbohydrate-binding domain-containing protein [Clostridia bacterium]|nr:carbohydrate-binding domain-containing protein [Clostridia bacterium]
MKSLHIRKLFALFLVLSVVLGQFSGHASALAEETDTLDVTSLYKQRDVDSTYDAAECTSIALDGTTAQIVGSGATVKDGIITITEEGTYLLAGSFQGRIEIRADEKAKVRLILQGVTIESPEGPAIYEVSADKVILTLAEDSVNVLKDTVSMADGEDTINGTIYCADDLSINGAGTLQVMAANHGIVTKDDLVIAGGVISVDAALDAVRGRDSVLVLDGTLTLTAGSDGICATNAEKEEKGWLVIAGGDITIKTGSGAGEFTTRAQGGMMRGGWNYSGWGDQDDGNPSQKGLKAATDLYILDGTIQIDATDDTLHAANVTVSGGTLNLSSGDDGIHADSVLDISGGTIHITQSSEGLEAVTIRIRGGEIDLLASDDGVNAAGGVDGSGYGGWYDEFSDGGQELIITGGTLRINAYGDGLDSNGSITMSGGTVIVSGPTDSGNGAIDYNGTFTLTGGILVATGATGMMQNVTASENQATILTYLSSTAAAGSQVEVKDGSGNVLLTFSPEKNYQCILVSTPDIQTGDTISILVDGSSVFSEQITQSVTGTGSGMGGFGGGFGGGPGGRQPQGGDFGGFGGGNGGGRRR